MRYFKILILAGLTAMLFAACSSMNPPENQTLFEELGISGDDENDCCP
ncbi:MAG: hypothetical protein ACOY3I_07550 [Verrucomicrobiota bacterium]